MLIFRSGIRSINPTFTCCADLYTTLPPALASGYSGSQYPDRSTSIWAPLILVAWRESDLSVFEPASAPLSVLPLLLDEHKSSSNTSGTSSHTPAATNSAQSSISSNLSTGTKVGIGIGVALAGLLLIATTWWLPLRWARKRYIVRHYQAEDKGEPVTELGSEQIGRAHV